MINEILNSDLIKKILANPGILLALILFLIGYKSLMNTFRSKIETSIMSIDDKWRIKLSSEISVFLTLYILTTILPYSDFAYKHTLLLLALLSIFTIVSAVYFLKFDKKKRDFNDVIYKRKKIKITNDHLFLLWSYAAFFNIFIVANYTIHNLAINSKITQELRLNIVSIYNSLNAMSSSGNYEPITVWLSSSFISVVYLYLLYRYFFQKIILKMVHKRIRRFSISTSTYTFLNCEIIGKDNEFIYFYQYANNDIELDKQKKKSEIAILIGSIVSIELE